MADKTTVEAIEKLKAARPGRLLGEVDGRIVTQQNFTTAQSALVAGLRFLVEDFRAQASLVMDSGARGKGAEATALRSTASALSLLADGVERINIEGDEPTPAAAGALPVEWCGSNEDHVPHDWPLSEPAGPARHCDGPRLPRDLSGLDALVAERAERDRMTIDPAAGPDFTGGAFTETLIEGTPFTFAEPWPIASEGTQADIEPGRAIHHPLAGLAPGMNAQATAELAREREAMRAYLAGETNAHPDDEPPTGPGDLPAEFPQHVTERGPVTDPAILEAAKVLQPVPVNVMFSDPVTRTYGTDPVMPGRRLTFAELRQPAPTPPAVHTSHSQVTQLSDCGLQGRLSRLEPGVIERPSWANIGGKAVHAWIEAFELMVIAAQQSPQYVRDRLKLGGELQAQWSAVFHQQVFEQAMAVPQVPQADWRASGRGGAEGYTWWLTQGPDMLQRYLDIRMPEIEQLPGVSRVIMHAQGGNPMIEHEGELLVNGRPHKVVLDQVWRWQDEQGRPALMIDDAKSGASAPRGGTWQLAQYAWYLRIALGYEGTIYGRFWNARTGEYSAPVDLIELHPWDEIEWRIGDAQAKKDAGLYSPNPGPFCGGCPVKHACPVVTRA